MRHSFLLLSLALSATLIGCGTSGPGKGNANKDSDGDGLTDTQEANFGTDSASPDTDADGLTDKEEFDLGTSGTNTDSDADGYLDFDEVTEGSNPADADSLIYTGGWPYYANKDSISDPGMSSSPDTGATFPRLQLTDQFGETVDIYDYAYQGKPIIVDLSGEWCYWCNEVAKWLEHDPSALDDSYGSQDWFQEIPGLVDSGDVLWVTVLDADWSGGKISQAEIVEWTETYPNENIAVLRDNTGSLAQYLQAQGYPSALALNEDMTIAKYNADYSKAFSKAYSMLP